MKISTEIHSASKILGEERAIAALAEAGFDAWDFSMFEMCNNKNGVLVPTNHPTAQSNYLAFARRLKQIGLDNGIVCNQSHAPFPTSRPEIATYLKKSIKLFPDYYKAKVALYILYEQTNQNNKKEQIII